LRPEVRSRRRSAALAGSASSAVGTATLTTIIERMVTDAAKLR
jgi:hypothetical protein